MRYEGEQFIGPYAGPGLFRDRCFGNFLGFGCGAGGTERSRSERHFPDTAQARVAASTRFGRAYTTV